MIKAMNGEVGTLVRELEYNIGRSMATVDELLELLQSERDALNTRDAESLTELLATKQAKIQALEAIETHRKILLTSNGYETDYHGMQLCLGDLKHRALTNSWEKLIELLERLHKQNHINGSVANLTCRFVERSLQILQGRESENSLYESTGQKSADKLTRSITRV